MKCALAILALSCVAPAFAQTTQEPQLKLSLPPSQATANATSPADDPPGTYYGDVSDPSKRDTVTKVSGSFTTTVGYAKGYGSGISNSADINVNTQLKNGSVVNLNIGVSRSNGPTSWGYFPYGR